MSARFLVVEDHPIVQLGLRQLIGSRWPSAELDVASTLAEAVALAAERAYEVAVVDLNLPDAVGLAAITRLRQVAPAMPILVLSLNDEMAYAQRVLQLGAAGYLSKERAAAELVTAMERISSGKRYITASQAERIAEMALGQRFQAPHEALSTQEYQVMTYLARGKRLTEIADLMNLSPKTVTTYRGRVLEKLGVQNNQLLYQYCIDHGITEA